MKNPYGEIYGYLKDIEIIDTHEHLPPWEKKRNTDGDVLYESGFNFSRNAPGNMRQTSYIGAYNP